MKRVKILALVIAVALVMTASYTLLAGCTSNPIDNIKASKEQVYAMSAVSSALYLQGNVATKEVAPTSIATRAKVLVSQSDIASLSRYLSMFEGCLLGGSFEPTVTVPSQEIDGEYSVYANKMIVDLPSVDGTGELYVMYYNEVPKANSSDKNKDHDDDEDELDDEKEQEIETTLDGVMILDQHIFTLHGDKTVEIEGNETEVEIEFVTTDALGNKIVVKQELEQDEVEYKYSVYNSGHKLVSMTKVELELESNNRKELSIKFLSKSDGEVSNNKYTVLSEAGTDNVFSIKTNNNGDIGRFSVTILSDKYVYTMADNSVIEYPKTPIDPAVI